MSREAKTKTRKKNKEDIIIDSLFWPVLPFAAVNQRLDSSRQPHVIQRYSVPPPQQDQYHRHDAAVYSMWMHFVTFCGLLTGGEQFDFEADALSFMHMDCRKDHLASYQEALERKRLEKAHRTMSYGYDQAKKIFSPCMPCSYSSTDTSRASAKFDADQLLLSNENLQVNPFINAPRLPVFVELSGGRSDPQPQAEKQISSGAIPEVYPSILQSGRSWGAELWEYEGLPIQAPEYRPPQQQSFRTGLRQRAETQAHVRNEPCFEVPRTTFIIPKPSETSPYKPMLLTCLNLPFLDEDTMAGVARVSSFSSASGSECDDILSGLEIPRQENTCSSMWTDADFFRITPCSPPCRAPQPVFSFASPQGVLVLGPSTTSPTTVCEVFRDSPSVVSELHRSHKVKPFLFEDSFDDRDIGNGYRRTLDGQGQNPNDSIEKELEESRKRIQELEKMYLEAKQKEGCTMDDRRVISPVSFSQRPASPSVADLSSTTSPIRVAPQMPGLGRTTLSFPEWN
jgi:hypothetical protein